MLASGAVYANLTSHTEALLDTLLLAIDSNYDGAISDETWFTNFLLISGIDNAPVESETAAPISSGYMYTHVNDADQHPEYLPDAQVFTAFTGSDATPDVSGGEYFQTADTTTITDFDDAAAVDGQMVKVLCLHAGTFDFTASGLTSPYGENHLMIVGSIEEFYYDLGNTTWVWATPKAPTATISENGVICRTGSGTASARTLATTSAGLDWTNGDGVAGAPNVDVDLAPSSGSATLVQDEDALQVKYDSTLTEGASGLGASGAFGALNLVTTGAIHGGVEIIADDTSLSAAQCYGSINNTNGAETITLPAAVAGMNVMIYSNDATVKTVDPDGTEVIILNGTALTGGYAIKSPGAAGDFITLVCMTTGNWTTLGQSGTWLTNGS